MPSGGLFKASRIRYRSTREDQGLNWLTATPKRPLDAISDLLVASEVKKREQFATNYTLPKWPNVHECSRNVHARENPVLPIKPDVFDREHS